MTFTKAVFQFLDYLFIARGAKAINWIVAEKNYKARNTYEKFIKKYFGHIIGKRHFGQKAYDGELSDILLFEVLQTEYFAWKKANKNEA